MNQKRKKGFTLIELLAVIVILAIIALIAVPVILNIIDKANKSAFKDTAYGIISASELYYAEQQLDLNGMEEDKTFNLLSDDNTTDGLQIKGNVPTGKVKVKTEGKVAIAVQNGRYCITKGFEDTDVTITENYETCDLPSGSGGSGAELGCDTLYWDGNTEGLTNADGGFNVSNVILTKDDLTNGVIVRMSDGTQITRVKDDIIEAVAGVYVIHDYVIAVNEDAVDVDLGGLTFTKTGIYFGHDGICYVTSVTIPGYTGFPHSEHCGH